jgi:hypothetical protein
MWEIFKNIIAGIFLIGLGYGLNNLLQWIKLSPFRKVWNPFIKEKDVLVILSTSKGPYSWSSDRVSFTETQAY